MNIIQYIDSILKEAFSWKYYNYNSEFNHIRIDYKDFIILFYIEYFIYGRVRGFDCSVHNYEGEYSPCNPLFSENLLSLIKKLRFITLNKED